MGILLRSAVVIGVIVYLSPLRSDKPPALPAQGTSPESLPLSGAARAVWQALPDSAKKTVVDEAQKSLIDGARRELLPETSKSPTRRNALQNPGKEP